MPVRPFVHQRPKHHRRHFWHILLEAAAGAIVMAFAPELAGLIGGLISKGILAETLGAEVISAMLGWGTAGAASSLASQGTAIVLKDQRGISWSAVGKSALLAAETAGVSSALRIDLTQLSNTNDMLHAAKLGGELAAAMQALTIVTGQQRHFDWRNVLVAALNAGINTKVSEYLNGLPDAMRNGTSQLVNTVVDTEIEFVVNRTPYNIENIIANALGTLIGNQLAQTAKQHYAAYAAEKLAREEAERQAAEARHQALIQTMVDQPTTLASPTMHAASRSNLQRQSTSTQRNPAASRRAANDTDYRPSANAHQHLAGEKAQRETHIAGQSRVAKQQEQEKTFVVKTGSHQIHDETDQVLGLISAVMDNTAAGEVIRDIKGMRKNFRTILYGSSEERLPASINLSTDIALYASADIGKGLATGAKSVASLVSKLGMWGRRGVGGAESAETLANRALNRVRLAQEEISATSPNASEALTRKYKALEGAQNGAVRTETLNDGRIRYYDAETLARTSGPTRGSTYVTEHNPQTGDVHTWMESYDQLGHVNRIHPKMYNGQTVIAPHYPPTLKDKLEAELYSSAYRRK